MLFRVLNRTFDQSCELTEPAIAFLRDVFVKWDQDKVSFDLLCEPLSLFSYICQDGGLAHVPPVDLEHAFAPGSIVAGHTELEQVAFMICIF